MMRRHLSLLVLPIAASFYFAGCLSDSDGDGSSGSGGSGNTAGSRTAGTGTAGGSGGAPGGSGGAPTMGSGGGTPGPDPSQNEANKDADPKYVTYLDNLATHPGCTKVGLETRPGQDNPPDPRGGYTSADIPG